MHIITQLKNELERLRAEGRSAELHPSTRKPHGEIETRGKRLIDFCSWDYLNLSGHPAVKRAAQSAIESMGVSSASSRLGAGCSFEILSCEKRIAEFFGREASLLFSTKNQAILSLFTAVANESDSVFIDELTQSAFADAAYLVNAEVVPYSPDTLDGLLSRAPALKRKFVVVEAVSPLTGTRADLARLAETARKHGALLIVDESTAIGALGPRGSGLAETASLSLGSELFCIIADFSMGAGGHGAIASGHKALIDYILVHSKTLATEPPLPAHIAAALETLLGILELKPLSRESLIRNARRLSSGLSEMGVTLPCPETPIVAIPAKRPSLAREIQGALFQRAILVEALTPRRQFSESAVVRFVLNEGHSEKQIDQTLEALSDILPRARKGNSFG